MILDTIVFTVIMITSNLHVMITMVFFLGAFSSIRETIGYVYLMEMTPEKGEALFGMLWCAIESGIILAGTLYFAFSETRNWMHFALIGYALKLIGLAGTIYLPESAKFLIG